MIQEVTKKPKISICRCCWGKGQTIDPITGESAQCEQCGGSGRVTVSARIILDIRPYKPVTAEP